MLHRSLARWPRLEGPLLGLAIALLLGCETGAAPSSLPGERPMPDGGHRDAHVVDSEAVPGLDAACGDSSSVGVDSAVSISNLAIEANPNNALSCYVSWTTDVPSSSIVDFGIDPTLSFRISDDALVTEHRVLVIGMRSETLYRLRASSAAADRPTGVADCLNHTTGELPGVIAAASVPVHDASSASPGWTLTNLHHEGASAAVAYDMEGEPVWYYVVPATDTPNLDVSLVDEGRRILIGLTDVSEAVEVDLAGDVVWTGPARDPSRRAHHHYQKLPTGDYLTLLKAVQGEVTGDIIEILAGDHTPVWRWDAFDHLPVGSGDWTHANHVVADLDAGWTYFNSRSLSALFKIDMSDGEVIWRFGQGGDFTADPTSPFPWVEYQHSPQIVGEGHVLFYDNGTLRGFTRLVEYALDSTAMTSTIVWEFPGDATDLAAYYTGGWHTGSRGDVQRLANGNTLVSSTADGFLFEVTRDRRVVWEMRLPADHQGAFRSRRVQAPLIITP